MKESLNQGIPLTIEEIMAGANKHAATDKTKDQEEGNKGHGGNNQNQTQNQNQNQGSNKRPYGDGSDFVANTNTGYKRKDNNSRGFQGQQPTPQQVLGVPCPRHARNGKCGHTLGECVDLQNWRNNRPNNGGFRGNNGGGPGNNSGPASPGPGQGGVNQQVTQGGFQQNPKQLQDSRGQYHVTTRPSRPSYGSYHVFTTSSSRRSKKLKLCAVNSVEPAVPQWLRWSEQTITWSRQDHPPWVEDPGQLALVVAPQVRG